MNLELFAPFAVTIASVSNFLDEIDRDKIKEYILNNAEKYSKNYSFGENNISSHLKEDQTLENDGILDNFLEVRNKIQNVLDEYCRKEDEYLQKITNSWFNIQTFGDLTYPHHHPNSSYSGVLYIESNPETQNIHYINPIMTKSRNTISRPCVPGDLIIWPSYLIHYVKPFSEDRRIAISFNTQNV